MAVNYFNRAKKNKESKVVWQPQKGSQVSVLECPVFEVLLHGGRGGGKAIALTQKVLTDKGWKQAKDITMEDKLISVDGTYTNIEGIFPHDLKDMYEVTFETGIKIKADAEHLWSVSNSFNENEKWVTKSTKEILDGMIDDFYYIPLIGRYEGIKGNICNNPYSLGDNSYYADSIPQYILNSDYNTRLLFLQGYMNAGGTVDKLGIAFCYAIKEQLALDVQYLVRSLGGKATITENYDDYKIYINHCNKFNPFKEGKKAKQIKESKNNKLRIISIEKIKNEPCVCFSVDHPSHLYVIEDFIVTHNTDVLLMDFAQHVGKGWGASWKGILFRENYPDLQDVISKSKKWYPQIFPTAKYNKTDHSWEFEGGEKLLFRQARVVDDYWAYHGHEYPWIAWEELTNWPTEDLYLMMMSVCRCSDPKVTVRRYISSCNPWGCYPYGRVLTVEKGLVDIKDVAVNDLVWSVDEKGKLVKSKVVDTIRHAYTGDMIKTVDGKEFTADHRFPIMNEDGTHTNKPFNELTDDDLVRGRITDFYNEQERHKIINSGFNLIKKKQWTTRLTILNYCSLLGAYIGSCGRVYQFGTKPSTISFKTNYDEGRLKFLKKLVASARLSYAIKNSCFYIKNLNWASYIKSLTDIRDTVTLPREIINYDGKYLQKFFDALLLFSDEVNSRSKQLIEDLACMAIKIGINFKISEKYNPVIGANYYTIKFISTKRGSYKTPLSYSITKDVESKDYVENKDVYCLTVDKTHNFFIEQNGKISLTGNSGHNWTKARFIDKIKSGEVYREVITAKQLKELGVVDAKDMVTERTHIVSLRSENLALMKSDPNYVLNIAQNNNPIIREAWINGNWDIMAGGMFDDVWKKDVHVIKPFFIPPSWFVGRCFDWGSSKPFAYMVYAISDGSEILIDKKKIYYPRGTIIFIDEDYGFTGKPNEGLQLTNIQIGKRLRLKDNQIKTKYRVAKINQGPADASIFATSNNGGNAETQAYAITKAYYGYETQNLIFKPSNKKPGTRVTGWQLMRNRLDASLKNDLESPHMYFFDSCKEFIRTIRLLQRDGKNPDDVNTENEDHLADAVRYVVLDITPQSQLAKFTI